VCVRACALHDGECYPTNAVPTYIYTTYTMMGRLIGLD